MAGPRTPMVATPCVPPRPPPNPREAASSRPKRRSGTSRDTRGAAAACGYPASPASESSGGSPACTSPVDSLGDTIGSFRSRSQDKHQLPRPSTHCGSRQRPNWPGMDSDPEGGVYGSACSAAGAVALESVGDSCRSCHKFRLRLEHEERARVKAQEQLVKLHAENLRLKRECRDAEQDHGSCSASSRSPAIDVSNADRSTGSGSCTVAETSGHGASASLAASDDIGNSLDSYRREVALLRQALAERDAREAELAARQRAQYLEHDAAKQAWEAQVAGLLCEVQDLEARNRQMEAALRTLAAASSGVGSTNASAGGHSRPSSDAATLSGQEDLIVSLGDALT